MLLATILGPAGAKEYQSQMSLQSVTRNVGRPRWTLSKSIGKPYRTSSMSSGSHRTGSL